MATTLASLVICGGYLLAPDGGSSSQPSKVTWLVERRSELRLDDGHRQGGLVFRPHPERLLTTTLGVSPPTTPRLTLNSRASSY